MTAERAAIDTSAWLKAYLKEGDDWGRVFEYLHGGAVLYTTSLIHFEIANIVLRQRMDPALKRELLALASDFSFQIVKRHIWWPEAVRLVTTHDLTFYDAAFTAVSVVKKLPMLSYDEAILEVLKAENIECVSL